MDQPRLSIGELARASGLSVSALRFYDGQGLLVPEEVTRHSGYRWYAPEQIDVARLIASLRRVGMPLAEMAALLTQGEQRDRLLDEHLLRLEEGLAAARAEVGLIRDGGNPPPARPGSPAGREATITTTAAELAAGLRTVRHAVGDDPDLPAINGVFLVALTGAVRLSATDRVRGAFAEVPADCHGRFRVLLPSADADVLGEALAALAPADAISLTLRTGRLTVRAGTVVLLDIAAPDAEFPDLSHAIPKARHSTALDPAAMRRALQAHPEAPAWWLHPDGRLTPSGDRSDDGGWRQGDPGVGRGATEAGAVLLDALYLAEALEALRREGGGESDDVAGQLRLDLDGPAHPLALRRSEDPGTFVVLLPIQPFPTAP